MIFGVLNPEKAEKSAIKLFVMVNVNNWTPRFAHFG